MMRKDVGGRSIEKEFKLLRRIIPSVVEAHVCNLPEIRSLRAVM